MENVKVRRQKVTPQLRIHSVGCYLVLLSVAFFLFTSAVAACPMCKELLFDPAQVQQRLSTARGYALSIGVLLMVPVSLIVGIATLILRAKHR